MIGNEIFVEQTGSTLHVDLGFQLSVANAPDLQEKLNAYKDQDIKEIVFDATDLVHLSSIGIRVFVFACQKFKHEPKIVFVNCAKAIYDTLDIVGITHMFTFVEDERGQAGPPENEWQEKLEELKNKDLEDFKAHNDVVVYQMKMGGTEE
jgi:anti-anti-sigma factor